MFFFDDFLSDYLRLLYFLPHLCASCSFGLVVLQFGLKITLSCSCFVECFFHFLELALEIVGLKVLSG
jgi:hypothetical protein